MLGVTLGSYRITKRLSAGGMGEVYEAEHMLIGRKAAIKLLLPEVSNNREIVDRFFNEAKSTAAIGHPGIVEIFDFGFHDDGRAYLTMEFLQGEPLSARLKRMGKLPLDHAMAMLKNVCSALGAAHRKGIVHRDLKPDNIYLVRDPDVKFGERPKLLDFGIAKLQDNESSEHRTRTGLVMGTPQYMAPEQCRGAGEVDHRADLYSLGCIFFALLCGRPPFIGMGAGEIIGMQQYVEPPLPSSIEPMVDRRAEALIMRLLRKRPEDRIQTTDELAAELGLLADVLEREAGRGSQPLVDRGRAATPFEPPVMAPAPLVLPRAASAPPVSPQPGPLSPMPDQAPRAAFALPVHAPPVVTVPLTPQPMPSAQTSAPNVRPFPAVPPVTIPDPPSPMGGAYAPGTGAGVQATTLHGAASESLVASRGSGERSRRWVPMVAGAGIAVIAGVVFLLAGGSDDEPAGQRVAVVMDASMASTGTPRDEVPGAGAAITAAGTEEPDTAKEPEVPKDRQPAGAGAAGQGIAADEPEPTVAEPAVDTKVVQKSAPVADSPDNVNLVLDSTPSGATVWLAGKRLGRTPYTHVVPRGNERLTFKLSMTGYQSERFTLSAARDERKTVSLKKGAPLPGDKRPDTKDPFAN